MLKYFEPYFSPLDKSSCNFFLILTIIFFIAFILILFSQIVFIAFNFNKITSKSLFMRMLLLLNVLLGYFVYRLFYSICVSSLK